MIYSVKKAQPNFYRAMLCLARSADCAVKVHITAATPNIPKTV